MVVLPSFVHLFHQGLTTGVDVDTAVRLGEAKNEAKLRQQLNKVEFLKAQLAAEQASTGDTKRALETSRAKLEELQKEFRYIYC